MRSEIIKPAVTGQRGQEKRPEVYDELQKEILG